MTNSSGVLIDTLVKAKAPIVGYTNYINSTTPAYILYVFNDGHAKITDARDFMTKSHASKVSRGKTKRTIAKVIDIPQNTSTITLNKQTFKLEDFSNQGIGGNGRKMIKPIEDGILDIKFNEAQHE